jgi:phage terminase large subunit-like protein
MAVAVALKQRTISPAARTVIAGGAKAEKCRRSLHEFMKAAWAEIEPGVAFEDNWHIKAFADHVQWMLEGWLIANGKGNPAQRRRVIESWNAHGLEFMPGELLVQNMVWNLAPETLKSRILMVFAPAWMWLHDPTWSVCCISSVDDVVKRDSNAHRDIVQSKWYRETFAIKWRVRRDIDAVGEWMTTAGGERKSRTILSGFVGVHVNALFLDDPDDPDRVWNESDRKRVQNKWTRVIKNRVKPADRAIRIATQQRVHVDDWTASQIAKGLWSPEDRKAWAWMAIPVLFGRGPKEAPRFSPWGWCDPRSVANENMHPARFSKALIADEERDRGPEGFEAQYNQSPDRFDGGMIKRADVRFFRVVDQPPATRARPAGCGLREDGSPEPAFVLKYTPTGDLDIDWLTITVDCSNGSERVTASQVGILVVGGKGLQRFVFDDRTRPMSIDDMYIACRETVAMWPAKKILIELAAAGASVISEMKKQLAAGTLIGPDGRAVVIEIVPIINVAHDSKEARAAAMVPAWRAGLVHVMEGASWLYPTVSDGGKVLDQGFVAEMCTFPKSKKNDRVDAMSQVMTYYRAKVDVKASWQAMSRPL